MMTASNIQRLRMTVWPGVPLPLPPLVRRGSYKLDRSGLALIGEHDRVDVKDADKREIYLKLHALNLDDPDAIVGFANTFGAPSGRVVYSAISRNRLSLFAGLVSEEDERATFERIHQSDSSLRRRMVITDSSPDPPEIITLSSFRFAASFFADLTDAWRVTNADPTFDFGSHHHWRLPYQVESEMLHDRFVAFQLLCYGLQPLLSRFVPSISSVTKPVTEHEIAREQRIQAEERRLRTLPLTGVVASVDLTLYDVDLVSFCALELFNHIVGAETYRRCHNEHCNKLFLRQYGRAEHGQSKREGVLYCSPQCAQAQAARNYRRRRAQRNQNAQRRTSNER